MSDADELPGGGASQWNTRELASAAKGGDFARFGELYERIAPALHTWSDLRIRAGFRAWIEPADVVQEVWCRAWRIFDRFDPEAGSFRYWIFRIAKNVLLEAFRKLRGPTFAGNERAGSETRLLILKDVPDDATGISQRLSRDEGLQRFADWARSLPEEDRKLLVHLGLEGLGQQGPGPQQLQSPFRSRRMVSEASSARGR